MIYFRMDAKKSCDKGLARMVRMGRGCWQATVGSDGFLKLWDCRANDKSGLRASCSPRPLHANPAIMLYARQRVCRRWLLSCTCAQVVRVRCVALAFSGAGLSPTKTCHMPTGSAVPLMSVAERPSTGGHHILTGDAEGLIALWDLRSGGRCACPLPDTSLDPPPPRILPPSLSPQLARAGGGCQTGRAGGAPSDMIVRVLSTRMTRDRRCVNVHRPVKFQQSHQKNSTVNELRFVCDSAVSAERGSISNNREFLSCGSALG